VTLDSEFPMQIPGLCVEDACGRPPEPREARNSDEVPADFAWRDVCRLQPASRTSPGTALASLLATVLASSAHGVPITIPGYSVTNLGTGTPMFSTDPAGNGILTTGSGQV
jgi:hypothetical protein